MGFPVVKETPDFLEGDGFGHEEVDATGKRLALVTAGC